MKKYIYGAFIIFLFIICTTCEVYALEAINKSENTYTITFISGKMGKLLNEENKIEECIVYENIKDKALWINEIKVPVVSPDEGYLFVGWSRENSNEILLNFPSEIKNDEVFVANFAPITQEKTPMAQKHTSLLYKIFLFCMKF